MIVDEKGDSSILSGEQDKAFENAIATYPEELEYWWEKITTDVTGKTLEEIKNRYEPLAEDIKQCEAVCVSLPSYSSLEASSNLAAEEGNGKKGQSANAASDSNDGNKALKADQERRKGIAWTEDEHSILTILPLIPKH